MPFLQVLLALAAPVAAGAISLFATPHPAPAAPEHFWPHARGRAPRQYGLTDTVAPHHLASALAWKWQHPLGRYHIVLAGGPVIDRKKNVYQSGSDGVRKFSPDGKVLWHYRPPGVTNNAVSLLGEAAYGSDKGGHAWALSLETGRPRWVRKIAAAVSGDSGYPAAYNGVFVVGGIESLAGKGLKGMTDGNPVVFGLDALTGETRWTFAPEHPVWNLSPLFPGDGSTVFMDYTGGMYRLDLRTGRPLWHTPAPSSGSSFSDGGATLGPDGVAYACSNLGKAIGMEGSRGALRAFALADGAVLWEQQLPQPCNSYPAVTPLGTSGAFSVVVTPGSFAGAPRLHGSIMAFEAATGALQWQYQAPVYSHGPLSLPKGDMEGLLQRVQSGTQPICLPAHWSAATADTNGTVYAVRADGKLYAVHGPVGTAAGAEAAAPRDADFLSSPGVEVEVFDADGAALHGAMAWAPGMAALGTCDTLYVFKF